MSPRTQLALFLCAMACVAVAGGVHESIFNNFLSDTFDLSPDARGWIEFPRELPGFLVVVMMGLLCALPITRLGIVGAACFGAGMVGIAMWGQNFSPMVSMMLLGSAGMHLLQPVEATLAIGLSNGANRGRLMGLVGAIGNLGVITGASLIWLTFDKEMPQYSRGFLLAGGAACLGAIVFSRLHMPALHGRRTPLVVRRKFGLYYLLEFLFGARKQIFITFGPYVLIREYGQPASQIAFLLMVAAAIGLVFKPLAGVAVDKFGERTVLIFDGLMLALVCVGYGYAHELTSTPEQASILACTCYVLDNLLFALSSARAVYISRIADSSEELTSTLSLGVTVNHAVSMLIPGLAGIIWATLGYERLFLLAALLALTNAVTARYIPRKGKAEE